MDIYGILAFPASHSLSPAIQNAGFKTLGINSSYDFFEITPDKLEEFLSKVRKEKIRGLSVSKPHKQAIMPLLDSVDKVALKIGAVNTVYLKNGKLIGTNTDWIGIEKSLLEKTEIKGKKIVILGAGGAARASVYACKKNKAKTITVLNRTLSKAKALAKEFACEYGSIKDFKLYKPDILIQATSAGLNKKEGIKIIPEKLLRKEMVVMEVIYSPLETKIIKDAQKTGAKTITGERMLLHQAVAAFKLWTSKKAPFKEMEEALNKALY